MRSTLNLWRITCADLIVRTAYQVGKTPLMPLFAASLGASEFLVGAIVSVSTMTGMVLKPIFGWLSDRWGRRFWLLLGLTFFSGMPFLYQFIDTSEQLFVLRLFHGLATAIFGPVTLALVAEMAVSGRAERLGWFGAARSGAYLLAPLLGGWLLTRLEPSVVFTIIGFASCLAFLPVCMMDWSAETSYKRDNYQKKMLGDGIRAFTTVISNFGFWFAGGFETLVYLFTYSIKAFLPLYALYVADFSLLAVGGFFTVQELAHLITRPVGGKLGDRIGYLKAINLGYLILGVGLILFPHVSDESGLLVIAVVVGVGQGCIFPSTVALVSGHLQDNYLGAGMGFLGAFRNLGKVAGPLITGALLIPLSDNQVFYAGGAAALFVTAFFLVLQKNYLRVISVRTKLMKPSETQAILR